MATPRIVAWRVGKEWSKWHVLTAKDLAWCGQPTPDHAALCELESRPAMVLSDLCKKCLIAYALSEAE